MSVYEFGNDLPGDSLTSAGMLNARLRSLETDLNVTFETVVLRLEANDYGTGGDRLTFKRRMNSPRRWNPIRIRKWVTR